MLEKKNTEFKLSVLYLKIDHVYHFVRDGGIG